MIWLVSKRGCRVWHRYLTQGFQPCQSKVNVKPSLFKTFIRYNSHHAENHDALTQTTRNIGIIAHIDAVSLIDLSYYLSLISKKGKTTTTERMLYYSGYTRRIGGMIILVT